jgi:adhesin transport system outer membrane protein
MYRLKWILLSSCLLAGVLSHPAAAETLDQAMLDTLNHHPQIEQAVASRSAADETKKEEFSGYFPRLNASVAGGRVYGDNSTSRGLTVTRGAAYSGYAEGSVGVDQMLFDGFAVRNKVAAADNRAQSADKMIANVREDLAQKTVLAYLDVMRSADTLKQAQDHSTKIADYQSRINAMVAEGAADESMSVQARDIKAQLDLTIIDLKGQVESAAARYAEVVGHAPVMPLVKPTLNAATLPADIDAAIKQAMTTHPELQASRMAEQAYDHDIKAQKAAYYPNLNTELSYLKRDQSDLIGGEAIDARALVRMNWAWSTGGAEIARVKKAKAQKLESRAQRSEKERQIESAVRSSYADMKASQDRLTLQRERLTINEDLFKTYQAQFEGSKVNLLQLLQTDNALFNTKLGVTNAEYRLLASQYAMMAGLGQMQSLFGIVPNEATPDKSAPKSATLTKP